MIQNISNYVSENYKNNKLTLASSAYCSLITLEMAIRTIGTIGEAMNGTNSLTNNYDFSATLGNAIFFGICSANILPGSSRFASICFLIYSIATARLSNAYTIAKIVGRPLRVIGDEVVSPILDAIAKVVENILKHINLPKEPIWLAVALLISAIVIYKLASRKKIKEQGQEVEIDG